MACSNRTLATGRAADSSHSSQLIRGPSIQGLLNLYNRHNPKRSLQMGTLVLMQILANVTKLSGHVDVRYVVLCCAVLCCIVLYCDVLYCVVLCCVV